MRNGLITMGLLAIALQGCGGGDTTNNAAKGSPPAKSAAKAKSGRAGAVVLVRENGASAMAEVQWLSKAGIVSVSLPASASLGALRDAISKLRARPDVDPARIAIVAEGRASILAAKLLERDPAISAAVLGNATAAAAAPLRDLHGAQVLLQRGKDSGSATAKASSHLVDAAPPGTLLYEYRSLADQAAADERDEWLRFRLK